jgi:sarcosine oxidase subunit beta
LEVSVAGGVLLADDDDQMADIERKVRIEREQGLSVQLLDHTEVHALCPWAGENIIGGEFCADEGKANPLVAAPAFAAAANRLGAHVRTNTHVTGIEPARDGFVVEANGTRVACRAVVDCAGIDAGRIAEMVGIRLPVTSYAIQASVTEPAAPVLAQLVYFAGDMLTLKQTSHGSLVIGGGWPAARDPVTGAAEVDPRALAANLGIAQHVMPGIGGLRLLRSWTGWVNAIDDWMPILGRSAQVEGFFVGVFPFMGFTAGPRAGALLSDMVVGRSTPTGLEAFTPVWL